jgi:glycosyltransferase involved in cell wall biosynthesis
MAADVTDIRAEPSDVVLLVPADDVDAPELSIVVPALDEELTIAEFVRWCLAGIREAGVAAEILIIDSSTDRTAEIAVEEGARVLRTPKRGLGRAYQDAIPFIRGDLVLMGDADCTYDFREIRPFVEKFREGFEFTMGSRFKGYIEPGSMPRLHQYFGTPFTTWILNRLYSSKFSDIHCGMRAISRDALERMDLTSQSWEYASEMVLKSVHMQLRTAEVPVRFLKDKEGRVSHHKRAGWFSPWQAAWINLRAMFIYGADFFAFKPGILLLILGLALTLPLSFGPLDVGPVTLSLYSMLAGLTAAVVGLQLVFVGCLAQVLYDETGRAKHRWLDVFRYTRTVAISAALFVTGAVLTSFLVAQFIRDGLKLDPQIGAVDHLAVTGMLLMTMAFSTFIFTLLLHATVLYRKTSRVGRR